MKNVTKKFPKWQTVYYYFQIWSKNNSRKEQTSFCIIDSQSVKNTDTAKNKGYGAGKKISGIKRHIAVDAQDLTHAIITTAEKQIITVL